MMPSHEAAKYIPNLCASAHPLVKFGSQEGSLMTTSTIPHPPIASRDQWLAQRKILQAHEKELTKHRDRINAERRRLPMVKIEKDYIFDGRRANEVSGPSSRVVGNSWFITSCSTQHGTKAVRAAPVM
jgi:hypothetical protein